MDFPVCSSGLCFIPVSTQHLGGYTSVKIFVLLPLGGKSPIVNSADPIEHHLAHLIAGLKYLGHRVNFGVVPDRKIYDVALAVEYSPYLKLVRAGKYFTDLYSASRAVPENDGVFFRSYYHQYLIRKHSNIELEKCFEIFRKTMTTSATTAFIRKT